MGPARAGRRPPTGSPFEEGRDMQKRGVRAAAGGILRSALAAAGVLVLMGASGAASDDEDKARAEALAKASITLAEAVNRAEAKTGGKAVEAELEVEKDALFFEVETLKEGVRIEVKIDARTGEVIATEVEKDKKGKAAGLAEALKTATVSLAGVIVQAESAAGGKAVEAELEVEKERSVFEVSILKDGAEIEVKIDPVTGKVLKIEKDEEDREEKK